MISPEYLAGFFDADGYVGVTKEKAYNYFGLRLTLINTNKLFLQSVQTIYGGHLYLKQPKTDKNHKWGYQLCYYGQDAKRMAMMLLPFSKIKASQLKLALEFPIGRKTIKGEFSAPKVDKQEQIRVYENIKALKQETDTN